MSQWERFCFGLLGASIVSVPPIWAGLRTLGSSISKAVQPVPEGVLLMLILAFVASVALATRIEARHPYESFFTGLGIPGIILSGTVATQGIL